MQCTQESYVSPSVGIIIVIYCAHSYSSIFMTSRWAPLLSLIKFVLHVCSGVAVTVVTILLRFIGQYNEGKTIHP